MNLDFSDDQKFLKEEARKFLEKENALLRNRTVLENQSHFDQELFQLNFHESLVETNNSPYIKVKEIN